MLGEISFICLAMTKEGWLECWAEIIDLKWIWSLYFFLYPGHAVPMDAREGIVEII
jgi:hypothetical protein